MSSVRMQVGVALGLYGIARGTLILSAPDVLSMVDQATWKHADLATDLARGQLPGVRELADLAWNGFNFHQVAFIPYCLGFALFALPFGSGYVALHAYAALFGALGVGAWAFLLARYGPRHSGLVFGVMMALAPIPAAMMQVRPYSGHTEAQGLAAAALALLLLRAGSPWLGSARRVLAAALVAGMSLSLSPLGAPILGCAGAALGFLLVAGPRPKRPLRLLGAAAVGLLIGLLPYLARALFAPTGMFSMPVVEYGQADPASILSGAAGPTLLATLWQPFHLVFDLDSVPAAHSYQGLADGDSALANAVLIAASLLCLVSAWRAREPGRRLVAVVLGLGPWATLVMVGVAGPDLCLRYLTGIYPLAIAAFAWCAGLLCAAREDGGPHPALRAVAAAIVAVAVVSWSAPGARDLARVIEPARWHAALHYAPGPLLSSTGLRAMPPVELWHETTAFLAARELPDGGWDGRGFDLPFLPLDDMSTQGWQPFPDLSPALVRERALVSGEGAQQRLLNMGWALAAASAWDPTRFEHLLSKIESAATRHSLTRGAAEGAAQRARPWPAASSPGDSRSRMTPEDPAAASPAETSDEVQ